MFTSWTWDVQSSLTVQVTFDPDTTGPRTLLQVVEDLGYAAVLDEDAPDDMADPAAAEKLYWRRKTCWAALFTVPVFLLAMVRHL